MSKRFSKLTRIMSHLRGENGCPWDKEQTPQSLKPFLLEEAYEVLEAIDEPNPTALKEELGDLLFQILFHSQIAKERGQFDIEEVVSGVTDKMTRRHPHVFGRGPNAKKSSPSPTTGQVLARWEELKQGETGNRPRRSVLDGVPKTLPALMRAFQLQTRASRVGFDWKRPGPAWKKINEEIRELRGAMRSGRRDRIQDEMGDLLFTLVNWSRLMRLDPEEALRSANRRFFSRFRKMEKKAKTEGRPLSGLSPAEWDRLWKAAKREEKRRRRPNRA